MGRADDSGADRSLLTAAMVKPRSARYPALMSEDPKRSSEGDRPAGDLHALYRARVMDHARQPRHFGKLAHATHRADGHNPLCGDRLTLMLECRDDVIAEVAFEGEGCALSMASASMLTSAISGRSREEAHALRVRVMAALSGPEPTDTETLGEVSALTTVRGFPARIGCVTLAWQTLARALAASPDVADHPRG